MGYRALSIVASTLVTLGFTVVACGGSDESGFGNPNDPNRQDRNPGGEFGNPLAPGGVFAACATSTADAALTPANLVIMYDRSGSMGDPNNKPPFDPNLKWNPVGQGMTTFLSDPGSVTLNASLQFFPVGETIEEVCSYDYGKPGVTLTPLTQSNSFVDAIQKTKPQGGTPTLPALQGAIKYAKGIATQKPSDTTVVVLVTDGEPGISVDDRFSEGCTNNDIPHVAAAARDALRNTPSVRTYVIGVGPSLEKLDAIAVAGGTGQAMIVDVQDPAKTTARFQKALEQVRSQTLSCDFAIPPAPPGQSLDANLVNVVYASGGKYQVLDYSRDCANGTGWRYDQPTAPTKISLCPTSCSAAQSDRNGRLTLAFGCSTQGGVIK
ncbi:hypothetical protein [Pendulispora albinea]|uniref:VWA domain-containing protein n=1 Tax=Pendulispora albinea TaxID=2741071 RepID=A0ABZ2LSF7_9BACT